MSAVPPGAAAEPAAAPPLVPANWQVTAEQVVEFAPNWVMFWADGVVKAQLLTWAPYLRRSRYRFIIVSSIDQARPGVGTIVDDLPNCMIGMPYETVRQAVKKSSGLKGVIYPTTRSPNFGVVTALPRHAHVWIGHGESEKSVNGPRTASLYDSVLVARYSALDRFPPAIRSWVSRGACAIGAPIVEGTVKSPWASPRQVKTLVYAPTWEGRRAGADYSSLPTVAPILLRLLPALRERGVTVIVRAHPGTGDREPGYTDLVKDLYAAGARKPGPKPDDFAAADLMISDVSGVTAEFLFTEKPILMPITNNLTDRGKDAATLAREYPWAYQWDVATQDLQALLDGLASSDPLRDRRAALARSLYRGHRSIDEAARTFDTALSSAAWRTSRVPIRVAFELKQRVPGLVRLVGRVTRLIRRPGRRPAGRSGSSGKAGPPDRA